MKVTVIGAGVIGLSCAFELSEFGHQVTVIDSGAVGAGGSAGNAGWITPFLSSPRAAPGVIGDALRSFISPDGPARMQPRLEAGFASWVIQFLSASTKARHTRGMTSLHGLAKHAFGYFDSLAGRGVRFEEHRDGLGVVFKEKENLDHYEHLAANMRSLGYNGKITIHRGADVVDFDPAIRRNIAGVMHLENERHVQPQTLTRGLAKAIIDAGGEIIENQKVNRIVPREQNKWTVVTDDGQSLNSDQVVVAAGYPSRALLRQVGVSVPLEAAKGTSLTAYGEGTAPTHPLKLYENMVACSPFGQTVRLSGTYDLGRRDFDLNRRRLDMVIRHGLSYLETWRPTEVEAEWVGHRSTTVDDLPIIGAVPGRPGLYLATGHGTLGVTLGPLTGALVAQEITHNKEQELLKPFRLERFRSAA